MDSFDQVPRTVSCDDRLSFSARGILGFIRGKTAYKDRTIELASGFVVHLKKGEAWLTLRAIARNGKCDKKAVKAGLSQLESCERLKCRLKTRFGTIFCVPDQVSANHAGVSAADSGEYADHGGVPVPHGGGSPRGTYYKNHKKNKGISGEHFSLASSDSDHPPQGSMSGGASVPNAEATQEYLRAEIPGSTELSDEMKRQISELKKRLSQ